MIRAAVLNPLPRTELINLYSDHCAILITTLSPQVVLINAVRDVAKALAELIGATKCAAGKPADDPSMYQLKSAAKVKDRLVKQMTFLSGFACVSISGMQVSNLLFSRCFFTERIQLVDMYSTNALFCITASFSLTYLVAHCATFLQEAYDRSYQGVLSVFCHICMWD